MARKRKTVTVKFILPTGQLFDGHFGITPRPEVLFLKNKEYEALDRCVRENLFRDGGIREWMRKHASKHHRRRLRKHSRTELDMSYELLART